MKSLAIITIAYCCAGLLLLFTAIFTNNSQRNLLDVKSRAIRMWFGIWILPFFIPISVVIGTIEYLISWIKTCWYGK